MNILPNVANERLDYGADLVAAYSPRIVGGDLGGTPGNEGHFEIDLGKFWLPVLAAVFIAETLGELEIFIHSARADEELLRLLRGLWE